MMERMVALLCYNVVKGSYRSFGMSNIRFVRFQPPNTDKLTSIGRLQAKINDQQYDAGQLFLHSAFAYRGIVLCSFNCKVYSRPKPNEAITIQESIPYYQVLIHKDDWEFMGFPYDLTSYLGPGGSREDKVMNFINGMDCVSHHEVLPYCASENIDGQKALMDHDLFERFFELNDDDNDIGYKLRHDILPLNVVHQSYWLVPQAIYKEVTENVEVQVMPYYLGTSILKNQTAHCWRYVTRIQSLDKQKSLILRSRSIKVFSLNSLNYVTGNGMNGQQVRLSPQHSVCQFSSHIQLHQGKGAYMWGKLRMEREDGEKFEVNIPTILLDSISETTPENMENGLT